MSFFEHLGHETMKVFFQLGADWISFATGTIFLLTYIGIAVGSGVYFKIDRAAIAFLGGIAILATGCLTLNEAVRSVSMESILLLFALMVIAAQLHFAGFYKKMAQWISRFLERPALFLAILMGLSALLSGFLNNDIIALAFTPVITVALLRKRMNPVPFLIALALSTNIGCALTFIGNAQNVLIGQLAHLSFGGYLLYALVPVTLSLAAGYAVIYFGARKTFYLPENAPCPVPSNMDMEFHPWRTTKGLGVLVIIVILFIFTPLPRYLVALTACGLLLCSHRLESRQVLSALSWQLLLLFIGLFIVVGAFVHNGLAHTMTEDLLSWNINLNAPITLGWISAVLSNLINNSAAVMLLVKVVNFTDQAQLGYALALSNALAGNFIIIGSIANIIVAQQAEPYGIKIGFWRFAAYGAPTAVLSMLILSLWLWVTG